MKGKQVGKGEMIKVGDQVRTICLPPPSPDNARLIRWHGSLETRGRSQCTGLQAACPACPTAPG